MTRLLLVEDHILVRQSIRAFLQDAHLQVVGEAGSGTDALSLIDQLNPDVVLLDIHIPEINGIELARRIRSTWPDIQIIVLTAYNEPIYQQALNEIGVRDFVLKTAEMSELIEIIQRAVAEKSLRAPPQNKPPQEQTHLTVREIEVLMGAAQGWTNKQIGLRLGISARTVQVHLHTIYQKLHVSNRTEAVLSALALKLISQTGGKTR
jgi:DNA-binding NarL/FixJ family response regulator